MSRKLLLADHSTTIQRVIELTFSGEDVQVIAVSDGEQAIQRIPLEKPDIVLADIGISRRNGYEVAAFVKQHPELSHVPVLLLAGAFEPVDEARARQVRCDGVLIKPFEPQQVIARVRELIDTGATRDTAQAAQVVARHAVPALETRVDDTRSRAAAEVRGPAAATAVAEPVPPRPQIGVASPDAATSLDDYFDRLGAAFATRGRNQATPPPALAAPPPTTVRTDDVFQDLMLPTIENVLSGASLRSQPEVAAPSCLAAPPAEPPDAPSTLASSPRAMAPVPSSPIAEASSLLLAVEQGAPDTRGLGTTATSPADDMSEELVDRIARRVIERLAPDAARDLVADTVSGVAERLVRAEIDRIKKA